MKARLVLEAARRKLVELDWIQGSYQKAMGRDMHFEDGTAVIFDEKSGTSKTIPITKSEAVCAMGAVELALSGKMDLGESDYSVYYDTPEYMEVASLLRDAIDRATVTPFDELPEETKQDYRESYKYELEDAKRYGHTPLPFDVWAEHTILNEYDIGFDSVEEWNDHDGRTKVEVVALFDRAIERARELESLEVAV